MRPDEHHDVCPGVRALEPAGQAGPHRHPDRYPQSELGGHNHCRNPDSERTIWCYTDLSLPHYDYCHLPWAEPDSPPTASPVTDLSCPANITVVVGTGWGSGATGSYAMTRHWRNGWARRGTSRGTSASPGTASTGTGGFRAAPSPATTAASPGWRRMPAVLTREPPGGGAARTP